MRGFSPTIFAASAACYLCGVGPFAICARVTFFSKKLVLVQLTQTRCLTLTSVSLAFDPLPLTQPKNPNIFPFLVFLVLVFLVFCGFGSLIVLREGGCYVLRF